MPSSPNYAWAAGLFEGEGCFTTNNKYSLVAALNMTDEDVVRKFHSTIGVGKVYGPYQGKGKPYWQWRVANFEAVQHVMATLWNFLGMRRKAKITELQTNYRTAHAFV